MSMDLKIACLQLNSQQSVVDNLAVIKRLCLQAMAQDQVQAIALPENAFCHPYDVRYQPELDVVLPQLQSLASDNRVWIFAGTLPTPAPGGKVFSRLHVIDSDGKVTAHYDKMHLFDVHVAEENIDYHESASFQAGETVRVASTPWGMIGLAVCYDLRFPELFISAENQAPFAWIVPSAFTFHTGKKHWQHLLSARAVDTFSWIVAPTQTGLHPGGRRTYGHASVVNPDGEIIAQQPEGVGYVVATINDTLSRERRTHIPVPSHRKISFLPTDQ